MKYILTIRYIHDNYSMTEEWRDISQKTLEKKIIEYLSIITKDGVPIEPVFEKVKNSLCIYVDDEFIEQEFKRLTAGYKTWESLRSKINNRESFEAIFDEEYSNARTEFIVKLIEHSV